MNARNKSITSIGILLLIMAIIAIIFGEGITPGFMGQSTPTNTLDANRESTTKVSGIGIVHVVQLKQTDGNEQTRANLSIGSLAMGQVSVDYPAILAITETRSVKLTINPVSFASLTPVPGTSSSSNPGLPLLKITDHIQIYPVMEAEVQSQGIEINPKGKIRKVAVSDSPVEWVWTIRSMVTGKHESNLEISIPVIVDGVEQTVSTRPLKNIQFAIQVERPSTSPTIPPPTSIPPETKAIDNMATNATTILVAIIGLVGGVVTLLIKNWLEQKEKKRNETQMQEEKKKILLPK